MPGFMLSFAIGTAALCSFAFLCRMFVLATTATSLLLSAGSRPMAKAMALVALVNMQVRCIALHSVVKVVYEEAPLDASVCCLSILCEDDK